MKRIIRLFKENADPQHFNEDIFEKECQAIASDLPEFIYTIDCSNSMDFCVTNLQSLFIQYRKIPHLNKQANNLLFHLEENFPDNTNGDKGCSTDNIYKLVNENIEVINEIYEITNASGSLLWPTLESFLVPVKNCEITLSQLRFMQEFFRKLTKYKEKNRIDDVKKFVVFLQHINLNNVEFFEYIVSGIEKELAGLTNREDQMMLLNQQYISFKHLKYITEQPFNKKMPGIGEQVSEWINAVIALIKNNDLNYNERQTEKIEFSGTTSELILHHLLMMEMGFYNKTSKKAICRFISNNYTTPKTDYISASKSYDKMSEIVNDVRTREALKSLLLQLLKKLN